MAYIKGGKGCRTELLSGKVWTGNRVFQLVRNSFMQFIHGIRALGVGEIKSMRTNHESYYMGLEWTNRWPTPCCDLSHKARIWAKRLESELLGRDLSHKVGFRAIRLGFEFWLGFKPQDWDLSLQPEIWAWSWNLNLKPEAVIWAFRRRMRKIRKVRKQIWDQNERSPGLRGAKDLCQVGIQAMGL